MSRDLYMIIGNYKNSIRNNLEIIDYNLELSEAQDQIATLRSQHAENNIDNEDWELDTKVNGDLAVFIVKQQNKLEY